VREAATIIFSGSNWWLPATVALVALAAALMWAGPRGATEVRVRFACGLLKLAAIVVLVICLLEPLWVGQRARPGANIFALVADNSQSLMIRDAGQTKSRGELLRQTLTGDPSGWPATLAENFQVRRYTFDSRLQSTRDFSELNFAGRASALGQALKTATEQWRGQPVAGVLLFTDGNATDIGDDWPALEGCPPVYPVVLGEDAGLTDLSLKKVSASQTAFEDAPVTIQAEVAASGFGNSAIVARLTEVATGLSRPPAGTTNPAALHVAASTNVVAELTQRAPAGDGSLNYRFQIQPAGPGLHFYELDTRARSELDHPETPSREATLVNNRQMLVVDRGQEPFRVLYISGRPNWDFKFLNRAVQDDPQVRMVSIMRIARREPKFAFMGRDGESSNPLYRGVDQSAEEGASYDQPVLIRLNTKDELELRGGFPTTAEELFKYDAVIVADLEADFFTHDQMALIQRFVSQRGGGFLMLGGAESFREGNYGGSLIASMLPVYLDRAVDAPLEAGLKLTLTREGWLQPWTRLRPTESEEKTRLDAMPPFEVFNAVNDIKPGASVLATVSGPDNQTHPALVAQRYGLGRTATLMIGDMWSWGMQNPDMQKDLQKSWRQLVRWLVSDVPSPVAVVPETSVSGDPAAVRLTVTARDATYLPLENATVQLTVRPVRLMTGENGAAGGPAAGVDTNFTRLTAEPSATVPGTYEATYIAREAGAYSVEALVTQADGRPGGQAAAGWASDPAADEFRSLQPNRALLETLARRTGGEVVKLADLKSFVRQLPARHAPITENWTNPLWQNPAVFLLVLGCLVAEWGLRRWKGLP